MGCALSSHLVFVRLRRIAITMLGTLLAGVSCAGDALLVPPGSTLQIEGFEAGGIVLAEAGTALSLTCRLIGPGGSVTDVGARAVTRGRTGVVAGSSCDGLLVRRSGVDTVHISYGGLSAEVELAVALTPVVLEKPVGEWMQVDQIGDGGVPWAPSARRNSRGEMEMYLASYVEAAGMVKGSLHRYRSADGISFRYDGVVLRPTEDRCTQFGDGIENVVILPRAGGAGWRMLFAAGSNICYGWQVFSAVSEDERTWRVEPGVRLDAGGGTPAGATNDPYWAQGEGMVVDQLADGSWRLLQGGMDRVLPPTLTFHITEWQSQDQLVWTYQGPVLRADQMPPGGRGSIYSPTILEFGPGLYRMIFTGDDRNGVNPRSRLWSAVSRDRRHWTVEGELLGAPGSDLWYSALVGERLVFIRRDANMAVGERGVAVATVKMP